MRQSRCTTWAVCCYSRTSWRRSVTSGSRIWASWRPAGISCLATSICGTAVATGRGVTVVSFKSRAAGYSSFLIARTGSPLNTTHFTAAWSAGSIPLPPRCCRRRRGINSSAGSPSCLHARGPSSVGISRPISFVSIPPKASAGRRPEGAHRDGVDYVAVILVNRFNVRGGETRVFEAEGTSGVRFTMSAPWSALLLDDAKVIHEIHAHPERRPGRRARHVGGYRSGSAGSRRRGLEHSTMARR